MLMEKNCTNFIEVLASSAPVPGGGGASAYVGVIGMALGSMVANLTLGKKKYDDVQADIKNLLSKADDIQKTLMDLVEKDAEVFEPLSKAYGLPNNNDEERLYKNKRMEDCLKLACSVPIKIMETAVEAIILQEELAEKGTKIALSDVGVGVLFCKSALMGASLNVFINTKLMKDRIYAEEINAGVEKMLEASGKRADAVYEKVLKSLK
ncbi:formiminotetrahydrofolate cyclodeaminase [Sporomusaceae bacterium BoRhaA]|uniref:cyclodeaminase/cyclohydrolase family protein n=1 Tax=Pelorhabdus rhamnosifermentans TaxID=2772457 RepID=UPI001C0646ED|nr:cyclodeaminase/cyclohydrolase family protein [Pelorhabdus rhamnosifermentans]MBU2703101.1 formiminotetrahydrofolate cyclodeaminase [Pelorhabdus rhamnosifermentans]